MNGQGLRVPTLYAQTLSIHDATFRPKISAIRSARAVQLYLCRKS